ncbi:hypothetical protein D3C83_131280 [compost metagenome]
MSITLAILTCGYSAGCRGRGVGFAYMVSRFGAFGAVYVSGQILGSAAGVRNLFELAVAAFLVAAIAAFIVDRHVPARRRLAD